MPMRGSVSREGDFFDHRGVVDIGHTPKMATFWIVVVMFALLDDMLLVLMAGGLGLN